RPRPEYAVLRPVQAGASVGRVLRPAQRGCDHDPRAGLPATGTDAAANDSTGLDAADATFARRSWFDGGTWTNADATEVKHGLQARGLTSRLRHGAYRRLGAGERAYRPRDSRCNRGFGNNRHRAAHARGLPPRGE